MGVERAEQRDTGRAKTSRPRLSPDGSIELGPLRLAFSNLASREARAVFLEELEPLPPEIAGDRLAMRRYYDRKNDGLAERMRSLFPIEVEDGVLGGVRVQRVRPPNLAPDNLDRALICLHGGGFTWGSGSGALVEAIPITATMGVEVIAVDYRMAPEHTFPAASEDVAAVWSELLERYRPEAVGIYGCSAGAMLTAQSLAWFQKHGLPRPGAIAMLGAGAGELDGDLPYLSEAFLGFAPTAPLRMSAISYFDGASFDDPLLAPASHSDILKGFPPTLLIAGGRDFGASAVTALNLGLEDVGVDTRLFIFDGLWHAFQILPELPESQQVFGIMARFFDRNLAT